MKQILKGGGLIYYTKKPGGYGLDDGLIFVFWKGNWMHLGNMGNPEAALQWRRHASMVKKHALKLLEGE